MALDSECGTAAARVIVHERVGSTNVEALALARNGETGPLWIAAREQTAGRGRRSGKWHSPPGNLYASLLLTDPCAPALAAQLSFVASLALHDALAALAPVARERLRLKWPNDLLFDDAKVAGILVEGETVPDGRFAAVIGIGVNCAAHPSDTPYPATDLANAGFAVAADALLDALMDCTAARLAEWDGGGGFDTLRRDWTAHAARLGETVRLSTGAQSFEGRFEGVDGHGHLVLALADGTRRSFSAGEVTLGGRLRTEVP